MQSAKHHFMPALFKDHGPVPLHKFCNCRQRVAKCSEEFALVLLEDSLVGLDRFHVTEHRTTKTLPNVSFKILIFASKRILFSTSPQRAHIDKHIYTQKTRLET